MAESAMMTEKGAEVKVALPVQEQSCQSTSILADDKRVSQEESLLRRLLSVPKNEGDHLANGCAVL
jgi:hypothetical protein